MSRVQFSDVMDEGHLEEIFHDLRPEDQKELEIMGFFPTQAFAVKAWLSRPHLVRSIGYLDGRPTSVQGFARDNEGRMIGVGMFGRKGTERVAVRYLDVIEQVELPLLIKTVKARLLRCTAWTGNRWSMRFLSHPRLDARRIKTVFHDGNEFALFERDLTEMS